eukprot:3347457-Prymnesium_polylepis.1
MARFTSPSAPRAWKSSERSRESALRESSTWRRSLSSSSLAITAAYMTHASCISFLAAISWTTLLESS